VQIIYQGNIRREVGRRIEGAGTTTGVKSGNKGVFEDPVCAGERGGEAGGDAVTCGLDFWEVEIHFGYHASHVDALIIANTTTAEVRRDDERRELFGCDLALADCTFEAGVGVFEDVEAVVHVIVVVTFDDRASEGAG